MKRIALCFATVAVLAACTSSANASDFSRFVRSAFGTGHYSYRHAARHAHAGHHADLRTRAIQREYIHHDAHHYPMNYGQHVRLHNDLNHSAYHDRLEHRGAHATRAYSPYRIRTYRYTPYGYGSVYRSH